MDLLNQLEENINTTLESYELLQLEVEELKEKLDTLQKQNQQLVENQSHWESKVKSLLSVFSDTKNSETEAPQDGQSVAN